MSKPNFELLLGKGYEYAVVVAYDSPFGEKGNLVSKHKTYDNAEKSLKRKYSAEMRNWFSILDTRSYV